MSPTYPAEASVIELSDLAEDSAYQRPIQAAKVDRMVASYDARLFRPIVVNTRKNGRTYLVDGQHRVRMLRAVFPEQSVPVPCMHYRRLSMTQEAALYVQMNGTAGERKLNPSDKHRAALVARDEAACDVDRAVLSVGWFVGNHPLRAVSILYRLRLMDVLDPTLKVSRAWYDATEDERACSDKVLLAIGLFLRDVEGVDINRACKAFAVQRPSIIHAQMSSAMGVTAKLVANTSLISLYNRGLRAGRVGTEA